MLPEEHTKTSRLPGFYELPFKERAALVAAWAGLTPEEQATLMGASGLGPEKANQMIENVAGLYALPLGIATNFLVNERDRLIPMVIEEPSVVAGISYAARMVRAGGGFRAEADRPLMIGQVQVTGLADLDRAAEAVHAARATILEEANRHDPMLIRLNGGAIDLEARPLYDTPAGPMLIVHLVYDVRDAMGANAVNTAVEAIAPLIAQVTGGKTLLRILSNLADRRLARAWARVPAEQLGREGLDGRDVARGIFQANAFALADPYRAATHNKGVMNGIDAVVIATGNDWRAIEAGAHAYAARSGQYRALTDWHLDDNGDLRGFIELPLAVGIVGGATRSHPAARVSLKVLGVQTAAQLAEIIAAVGLAQNLAALRALASEGIQRGHMSLHARQIALAAGATGALVEQVAGQMVAERAIRLDRAQEILASLTG
jgi:hydroxymethylglutaryl-CoA reductase